MAPRPRTFLIHPPPQAQTGGPRTFAGHLQAYLEANGYRAHGAVDEGLGCLIVFVQAPLGLLRRARRLGIPVLLRLDGAYYPRKHGWMHREYLRVNLKVWIIRRWLCDRIVYQSRFSQRMLDHLLGKTAKPSCIIHNGIAGSAEAPVAPAPRVGGPLRLVATGRFRGDDMLPPTVRALDLCRSRGLEVALDVYGAVDGPSGAWLERPYIRALGKVENAEVRRALPAYDALIFTQTSPSCPNVVVEAMAAGLPVIAFDTGAVKELLAFNGDLIAATPVRLLHGTRDLDPAALAECVLRFAGNRRAYREEAQRHRGDLPEGRTLGQYLELLEEMA